MDAEKLQRSLKARGWDFKHFATGDEAADYLAGELSGASVGIGGCGTADAIGLYDKLKAVCPDVAWHWKEEDQLAARMRAMTTDAYVCSANAIAETGEIVNIDGMGNRIAATTFGHKRLYIVAGKNKVCPDLESAIHRARNVAAPLRARSMGMNTPCTRGEELKCYDCSAADRVCCAMTILMHKMMGMDKCELILIDQDLGM
ncbi:MAG TPA: lactate utilization protein [Candidatus Scatomorpha gallistercoris]|nr:lactate utilization protein [Candidatus Scatomorpha gallistercoris]